MLGGKPEERPEASELKTDLERLNTEEIERRGIRSVWSSEEEKNHGYLFYILTHTC